MISGLKMFDFLHKIGFERLSTTEGERRAADLIAEEIRALGVEPVFETFDAPKYTLNAASLAVTEPFAEEIPCVGYGFSGNAAAEGLEAELCLIEGFDPMDLVPVKGKIVFYAGGIGAREYEKLVKAGALGFITTYGDFRDRPFETDPQEKMLRDKHIAAGQIPGVAIHIKEALKYIPKRPSRVKITLAQEEGTAPSQNIVVEIPGTSVPDEIVVFTAHYDSVKYSRGYYDNATGVVMLLEFLRDFIRQKPARTLRFLFCGSEERGLLGSKAYVAAHADEMEKFRLCINMDMAGPILGREMASVTGEESLCHALTFFYKAEGFPMQVRQDIYSSDSIPFADAGVPGINFFRAAAPGSSRIHGRYDMVSVLSQQSLAKTASFVLSFARRVIDASFFPIERVMPDNMVEKINKYLMKEPDKK